MGLAAFLIRAQEYLNLSLVTSSYREIGTENEQQ